MHAGAGDLDLSFGDGGLVTTDIGGDYNFGRLHHTLLQADGKIITGAGSDGFHLVRHNPDGTLDESFGEGGDIKLTNPDIAEFEWKIIDIAPQPDGKIILAGITRVIDPTFSFSSIRFHIRRFNQDGTLDGTFGTDGTVTADFSNLCPNGSNDYIESIAVHDDGSIIVIGHINGCRINPDVPYEENTIIVRYTAEGERDMEFGGGGIVFFEFGFRFTSPKTPVVQPDGKILVFGTSFSFGNIVVRLHADGGLDTTFGTDGIAYPPNPGIGSADAIALLSDGKIVYAGLASVFPETCGFGVSRLNADGSLDTTFGDGGKVITDFGCVNFPAIPRGFAVATSIAIGPDNKIVALGYNLTFFGPGETTFDFALARYNPDGSPDQTFGIDGKIVTEFASRQANPGAVLLQADGKIIAPGDLTTYPVDATFLPDRDPILVRYNADGSLDDGFGTAGIAIVPVHWHTEDFAQDIVAMQGDGKILVGGNTSRVYDKDFSLVRYNADGSLDPTFGENGVVLTDFSFDYVQTPGDFKFRNDYISALSVQPDGNILAIGYSMIRIANFAETSPALAMARYLPDGSPDETFGIGGRVLVDNAAYGLAGGIFNDIALQHDGKIVVVGKAVPAGFIFMRFNPDGTPDESFGSIGMVTIDPFNIPGFLYEEKLTGVAIQPDGKIVAAGTFDVLFPFGYNHLDRWTLFRLNTDGSLDTTFGPDGGGVVGTFLGNHCSDLALQSDGKIVVSGSSGGSDPDRTATSYFTVVRYMPDGSLDPSFGIDGMADASFDQNVGRTIGPEKAQSLALQGDGRILAGGYVTRFFDAGNGFIRSNEDFGLVRFESDGSLDYSFGNAGKVMTEFGSTIDRGNAVAIQADGNILLAGNSSQNFKGLGEEIAIVRYQGVATRVDELEGLVLRVQELTAGELLNDGQAKSLQAKLQAAIQQVDRNRLATAANQLDAFINDVEALVLGGVLPEAEGKFLVDEALMLIGWFAS